MYCALADDACNLQKRYEWDMAIIRQEHDDRITDSAGIDLGIFNGRAYSMITVGGKPLIVIENLNPYNRQTQFLDIFRKDK